MLHTFKYAYHNKSYYFIWDVESGSLYNIDYAAFLVTNKKYGKLSETGEKAYQNLNKADIDEITNELKGLDTKAETKGVAKYSGELKAMCLHICHDCNLKCEYCFAKEGTYNTPRDYMSFEVGKQALDFLIKMSGKRHNLEVDFFGGEPLLNLNEVKKIVNYARELEKIHNKKFSFTMTTNGLLLNKENSEYLNREMDNIVISIDGRKEVHNALRKSRNGKDCYDVIMDNAKYLRSIRGSKRYYIRGTFTAKNLDFCEDIKFVNDNGFDQISIEPVVLPDGNELAIKDSMLDTICAEYEKLTTVMLDRRKGDKWFNFFHYMIDLDNGPCVKKRSVGCGAGNEYVAVTPLGDIYPCHQFAGEKDYLMGNVFLDNFNRDIQKTFAECNLYTKDGCQDCWAKYYCSGGCAANAVHFNKDINKPYKTSCTMMRKRTEMALALNAIERINKEQD